MSVFDNQMNYIESPDLDAGYLMDKAAKLIWNYVSESDEQGHWETRYEDGTLVDMEHYDGDEQPDESWDHTVEYTTHWDYNLYTLYTSEELEQITKEKEKEQLLIQLGDLEQKMYESDAVVMQIVEQQILGIEVMAADAQQYAEIIAQRMDWRSQIAELKSQIQQDGDDSDV